MSWVLDNILAPLARIFSTRSSGSMALNATVSTPDLATPMVLSPNASYLRARPASLALRGEVGCWYGEDLSAASVLRNQRHDLPFRQTTASPRPAIPSPFTSPKATPSQPQVPNLATPSIPARDTFSTPGMTPSFPSDTDITSPQHDFLDSSFNISLVSDTSSIDDSDISLPSALSTPTSMRARDATRSPLVGLGLFGLYKKDGQPFDGLGVLPPRSSPWDREPEVMEGRLSDAFLAEVWHTFSEDPFHGHVLTSISECDGELSEEEDERGTREGTELQAERGGEETRVPEWEQERATMAGRIAVETSSPKRDAEGSKLIVTRHLSTSTISSELKRRQRPSVVKRRASMPVWLI